MTTCHGEGGPHGTQWRGHRERQWQLLSGGSCVARGIRVHTRLGSSKANAVHPRLPACSNGGISLISSDGRIVCSNTLDDRLNIAYHANLPEIRSKLFGAAAAGEISSTVPAPLRVGAAHAWWLCRNETAARARSSCFYDSHAVAGCACCCCLQASTDEPICDGRAYALCLASAQHCPTDADPCKQLLRATCPVRDASFFLPPALFPGCNS